MPAVRTHAEALAADPEPNRDDSAVRKPVQREREDATSIALTRYGILMSYLQYENTMFWQRAGFFLIASSGVLAFTMQKLPTLAATPPTRLQDIAVPIGGASFGLVLAVLWYRALKAAAVWIAHWTALLGQLEPEAFGGTKVMPTMQHPLLEKRAPLKAIAYRVVGLFIVLWIASLLYCVASVV